MSIISKYEDTKKVLLESYDLLLDCDPVLGKGAIPEQKVLLESEKFIISICGAIKTGKSTLINYLLFNGDEVLPVDATPETAKLAKIAKGEANKAVVFFLNKREFEEYKKSPDAKSDDQFAETLANIRIDDYIMESTYSIELDDLTELGKYMSKKSTLAPLVKYSEIFINEKILDNIVVVDTPGLNDPCKARSEVTLNWVSKTDALIFITPTKQALTEQDIDFLDEFCSHIDPEKLILVLGRADLADYQEVQQYVTGVLQSEGFSKRVYLNKQKPYPISVLAAMLKNCPDKVKDIGFYRKKISPKLVEKEGFMPELEKAVNSSIMTSKGQSVINSHIKKIDSLLKNTVKHLEMDIILYEDQLENFGKDKNEIELKRTGVERLSRQISDTREALKKDIERQKIELLKNAISNLMQNKLEEANKSYSYKCRTEWVKFKICLANTPSHFRSAIKKSASFTLEHQDLSDFRDKINDLFGNTYQKLKQMMVDANFNYNTFKKPIFSLHEVYERIDEMIDEELIRENFQDLRQKTLLIFTKHRESIEYLICEVDKVASGLNRATCETLINHLEKDIIGQLDSFFSSLDNYTEGMNKNIESFEYDIDEQQKKIVKIQGDISEKQKELQQVSSLKNEISGRISITSGE